MSRPSSNPLGAVYPRDSQIFAQPLDVCATANQGPERGDRVSLPRHWVCGGSASAAPINEKTTRPAAKARHGVRPTHPPRRQRLRNA